uniref:MAP kinase-activating death domain protein n=1 Tax=Echinostoma caproni TaxID=27848 RepID=A0A183AU69_9TREM
LFKANRLISTPEPKPTSGFKRKQMEKTCECVIGAPEWESESDTGSVGCTEEPMKSKPDESSLQTDMRILRKSASAGSHRFINGKLIPCDGVTNSENIQNHTPSEVSTTASTISTACTRVYLYEALVQPKHRSRLWDHMQFWEDTFFDTVAQERDMMGLDQAPMEMLEKFYNLTPTEKRILQCQEDRLLATCLYNLIGCMLMMKVDREAIRTRIRRIQARCRLGSYFSNTLSHLLDQLQYLEGNAVDLLPTVTRCNCLHTFHVQKSSGNSEDCKIFEIYKNCIILRDLTGAIINRMDCNSSLGVMLSADEHAIVLTMKRNGVDVAESYYSHQARQIYDAVKIWLDSVREQAGNL